jgi:hypothetical protein
VSLPGIIHQRVVTWLTEAFDFGYERDESAEVIRADGFTLRFRRRGDYGPPPVILDIREDWAEGDDDLDGPRLETFGCHLVEASWHAQIDPGAGAFGAERFDVDRSKPPQLVIHRHPFGEPNDVRVPDNALAPRHWLDRVARETYRNDTGD